MCRPAPLLISALCFLAGCASSQEDESTRPPEPVRLAVIAAPRLTLAAVDPDADSDALEGPLAEDLLYEAIEQISLLPQLDACVVLGPLFRPGLGERGRYDVSQLLVDAVGSLAAPTVVALAGSDAPYEELLLQLAEFLPGHDGALAQRGPTIRGLEVVSLGPAGQEPESAVDPAPAGEGDDQDDDEPAVPAARRLAFFVNPTPQVNAALAENTLLTVLPALDESPHLITLVTITPGAVGDTIELEYLPLGEGQGPPPETYRPR